MMPIRNVYYQFYNSFRNATISIMAFLLGNWCIRMLLKIRYFLIIIINFTTVPKTVTPPLAFCLPTWKLVYQDAFQESVFSTLQRSLFPKLRSTLSVLAFLLYYWCNMIRFKNGYFQIIINFTTAPVKSLQHCWGEQALFHM